MPGLSYLMASKVRENSFNNISGKDHSCNDHRCSDHRCKENNCKKEHSYDNTHSNENPKVEMRKQSYTPPKMDFRERKEKVEKNPPRSTAPVPSKRPLPDDIIMAKLSKIEDYLLMLTILILIMGVKILSG